MKKLIITGFNIILIVFIGIMNSSCSNRNLHATQTSALDSIATLLNKTDSVLSKTDTALIKKCVSHIFITLEDVQMNNKDTVSKGASEILRSFNSVRWELQTFLGKQSVLKIELMKSAEQLGNLSHDIKINRLPADSLTIYYDYEMKKAKLLLESAQQSMNSVTTQMPLYNLIVPKADSLINRLRNHQNI